MKFKCDNGHYVDVDAKSVKAEKTMLRKSERMLIVCPYCKPENVKLNHVPENKFGGKEYVCSKNHLTTIYPFTNGMCNISWGDEQENLEADPEVMNEMILTGGYKCGHAVAAKNGKVRKCNCKLSGVDSSPLSLPSVNGIKTKVRVGDIWDKAGCPEPKDSSVQIEKRGGKAYDASLNETEFGRRNKVRVREMRRRKAERLAKPAGQILDKATNASYKEGGARRPKKSDL